MQRWPVMALPVGLLTLLLLLLLPLLSMSSPLSNSGLEADYYTAGVVEFRFSLDNEAGWLDNLQGYLSIVNSANASGVDIIVFPELTLNGLEQPTRVPAPAEQLVPCLSDANAVNYHAVLVRMSCAARTTGKYIVINVNEQHACPDDEQPLPDSRPCAANQLNIYNTNVVFDRQGAVISRYRKIHLYGEPRNSSFVPQPSYFDTDFGVRFGHFICFDILFYRPAHELLLSQGIRDFVYPTMWFSQLPFLSGVQFQQGWAYANDVNLLAAGSSRPELGTSGSGIYNGRRGTLVSVMNQRAGERRLYVARVPKLAAATPLRQPRSTPPTAAVARPHSSSADFRLKRDDLEQYTSEWLDLSATANGQLRQHLCHDGFCCHFELAWQSSAEPKANASSYYSYRLGAYAGPRNEQRVDANYIRNCALFACLGPRIEQCGMLHDPLQPQQLVVSFTRLVIEASYPQSREFLLMPNSLRDNLLPLEPGQFDWLQQPQPAGQQHSVRLALHEPANATELLTFAIYGNYYDDVCTHSALEAAADCDGTKGVGGGGAPTMLVLQFHWWRLLAALTFLRWAASTMSFIL